MLLSEAYEKGMAEFTQQMKDDLAKRVSKNGPEGEPPEELIVSSISEAFGNPDAILGKYMFDGAMKEFVNLRSKKRATAFVNEIEDWSDVNEVFERLTNGLFEILTRDFLTMFSMGYTFFDPANLKVPRTKEGFAELSRTLDRALMEIQVARFEGDVLLVEKIKERFDLAALFVTNVFSASGVAPTKFGVRDWLQRVMSIIQLDCFVGGAKVRELLEEEANFLSMMKGTDE